MPEASKTLDQKNKKLLNNKTISLPLYKSFDIFNNSPRERVISKNLLCPQPRLSVKINNNNKNINKSTISAPLPDFRHIGHISDDSSTINSKRRTPSGAFKTMKSFANIESDSPVIKHSIPVEKAMRLKTEKFLSISSGVCSLSSSRFKSISLDSLEKVENQSVESFGKMEDLNISFGNLINDVLDVMHKDEYKEIPKSKKRVVSCSDPACSVISSTSDYDHEKYENYENKHCLSKQESRFSSCTKSYRSSELVPVLEER